ncbi:hypothetical protein LTR85_010779 [Meristemomyces frigidus]|nr:hypothetical protein LTR85_010779 [Meristemomyces frigidus]
MEASVNGTLDLTSQMYPDFDDLIMPMVSPGAGLKQLDGDQIFDSIFGSNSSENNEVMLTPDPIEHSSRAPRSSVIVRGYACDADILNAYYIFIHPFFPILPPPEGPPASDCPTGDNHDDYMPSSPITLAISTILALIPSPQNPAPQSEESVHVRRDRAQLLANMTLESIEIEAEVVASITTPAQALSSAPSAYNREPFHSRTPLELESTLAFLLLSIYEYAQRGNLVKMRNRAGQAHDAAIRLSLHEDAEAANDIVFGEARRRAWWMTYVCVLQGSIVGSTAPMISANFRQFRMPLPTIASDPDAWTQFLDAQHCILRCTQYTVALKKGLSAGSDLSAIQCRMLALDEETSNLIANAAPINSAPTAVLDSNEQVLAASLRAQTHIKLNSCRIKLHRYKAFLDKPLFTRRHCDLERAEVVDVDETYQLSESLVRLVWFRWFIFHWTDDLAFRKHRFL